MVRIVIADRHPVFREGLRHLLESEPGMLVAGEAGDGSTAAALVRDLGPDILLLGLRAPGRQGLDTLLEVNASGTLVRMILLTKRVNTPEVIEAMQHGARGVVPTDSSAKALFESMHSVMAGRFWIGDESATNVDEGWRKHNASRRRTKAFGLTSREMEIVEGVVAGDKNSGIARRLSISENTVKRHLTHIFDKLGASSRVELALFASYHRLLDVV